MFLPPIKNIKTNRLMSVYGNETPLGNVLKLAEFSRYAFETGELDNNLRLLPEELIRLVHKQYGGHGLTNLMHLAMGHNRWEFDHFISYLRISLSLREVVKDRVAVEINNKELPSNQSKQFFNTTYLQSAFARPAFAAGRQPGSLVYGVSGPKILISHPFQGINGDIYNMYDNTSDLVAALIHRGFHGRFHFLDYMSGLDDLIGGVPRWAIWFSIIAQHSDLVVFVKRFDGEWGDSQILESEVIPDWVPKTIESIGVDEIQNSETPELDPNAEPIYIGDEKKILNKHEWEAAQRTRSEPYINFWSEGGIPKDRFVHISEDSTITEYPLSYKLFI